MNRKVYFVVLSTGAYSDISSDYSPEYWVGPKEITQKELNNKAKEIEKELWGWYKSLPERTSKVYSWEVSYRLDGDEEVHTHDVESKFFENLQAWLKGNGYTVLPDKIPEINIDYGLTEPEEVDL